MANINLLPKELFKDDKEESFNKKFFNLAYLFLSLSAVVLIFAVSAFILIRMRTSDSEKKKSALLIDIKNLQASEQRLVLFKDRLVKIDKLLSLDTTSDAVYVLEESYKMLTPGVSFYQATIAGNNVKFVVNSNSSREISNYVTQIASTKKFSKIVIDGLSYTPSTNYIATIEIIK